MITNLVKFNWQKKMAQSCKCFQAKYINNESKLYSVLIQLNITINITSSGYANTSLNHAFTPPIIYNTRTQLHYFVEKMRKISTLE